jgi:hypothetical protein
VWQARAWNQSRIGQVIRSGGRESPEFAWCSVVVRPPLWCGLPTAPPTRPQVSRFNATPGLQIQRATGKRRPIGRPSGRVRRPDHNQSPDHNRWSEDPTTTVWVGLSAAVYHPPRPMPRRKPP